MREVRCGGAALDARSGVASDSDAQALPQDGADLLRSVGALMDSLVTRIGDSVDGLLAIWMLGRDWHRG